MTFAGCVPVTVLFAAPIVQAFLSWLISAVTACLRHEKRAQSDAPGSMCLGVTTMNHECECNAGGAGTCE